MRKVCTATLSTVACLAVSGAPVWTPEHQSLLSTGYLHAPTNVPSSDDPNGINVKYRYESMDILGMVTLFSYVEDRSRQPTHCSDIRQHEDSVCNRWLSVTTGPLVHTNERLNMYAMTGVAYSRIPTFSGDYLRVADNKGRMHDVLTGSGDGCYSSTSLTWGAGVRFNPTESVVTDTAYEGSGGGDWCIDDFVMGVSCKS